MDAGGTKVMMLGRTGDVRLDPQLRPEWVHAASTYAQPQNLLRPTLQTYPGAMLGEARRALSGAAQQATLGKIGRFLGDNGDTGTPSTTELAPPAGNGMTRSYGGGMAPVLWTLVTLSAAASAYHGYRRNQSVGWAVWWGLMGYVAPVITPAIGVAQGFGKRKR